MTKAWLLLLMRAVPDAPWEEWIQEIVEARGDDAK